MAQVKEKPGIRLKESIYNLLPNPYQPASRITLTQSELERGGESLVMYQQISDIVVRPGKKPGTYEVADGWRRREWARFNNEQRALPEWGQVNIVVREYTDEEMSYIIIEANGERKDLSPIDEALKLKQHMDEFHITQIEMAIKHHCSQAEISNKIRLLELPEDVQKLLITQVISETHCRILLAVKDPIQISLLASEVAGSGMTVAALDVAVKQLLNKPKKKSRPFKPGQTTSLFMQPPAAPEDTFHKESEKAVDKATNEILSSGAAEQPSAPPVVETPAKAPVSPTSTATMTPAPVQTPPTVKDKTSDKPQTIPAARALRKMTLTESNNAVIVFVGREGAMPFMKNMPGTFESVAPELVGVLAEASAKWESIMKPAAASTATITLDKPIDDLPPVKEDEEEKE